MLTNRDLEILQFIFEQRVVSQKQIGNRFFAGISAHTVHVRLTKLSVAGYLNKLATLRNDVRIIVYSVTDKGVRAFGKDYRFEITKPLYRSDSVNHDLGLVNVRERLEKMKMVVDYISESVLQSCGKLAELDEYKSFSLLNSDAAIALRTPKNKFLVALEYETSRKEASRYLKTLTDYYYSPTIAAVFYICGNTSIERAIRKTDLEVGEKFEPKVFTCLEDVIHRESVSLPFINRKNATFLVE